MPIPQLTTDGCALARALLWRQGPRSQLTIAIKATYEITTSGSLVLVPPRAFEPADEALAFTGDLAPFKLRCDVTFRGSVFAQGPSVGVRARFAMFRGDVALFDRRLFVFGERDARGTVLPFTRMPLVYERAAGGPADPANPVGSSTPMVVDAVRARRPGCLAPIPPAWPVRSAQLAGSELRRDGADLVLSPVFPAPYFQEAPFEQQVDSLAGGERILLEGLSARVPVLAITVPSDPPSIDVEKVGVLTPRLDTVSFDGDSETVSFVWRATRELPGSDAPASAGIRFKTALAAQGTAEVDPTAAGVQLAPFLVALRPAPPPAPPPPPPPAPAPAPPPPPAPPLAPAPPPAPAPAPAMHMPGHPPVKTVARGPATG